MTHDIKESDWKLLRQSHPVALQRLCDQILSEIGNVCADTGRNSRERYQDVFQIVKRRDREIVQTFDDFQRSTALGCIAAMRSQNLLTDEEFSRFSAETRDTIEALLGSRIT
jgi:hypothetical protein